MLCEGTLHVDYVGMCKTNWVLFGGFLLNLVFYWGESHGNISKSHLPQNQNIFFA